MKLNWLLILLCAQNLAWAETPGQLNEAKALFDKGAYHQSAVLAEKAQDSSGAAAFLAASAYSKMQAFDQALPHYRKAVAAGVKEPALHYDYGQALFATRNLKEAEAEFKKSIVKQFKMAASAYYVGYIRQLQEDREGAKDFYQRIQRLSNDTDKVKQPALYQIADMENERISEESDKFKRGRALLKEALPLYKKARDFESGTPTAEQASAKIAEIERETEEFTLRMVNGNPIPKKAYILKLSQELGYDSNVITEADGALIQVSNKDSFVSKTGVFARYQWNWRRTFSFLPELNAYAQLHARRSTPRVYQNDNIVIAPALRSKWEHKSRGKPATALFDIEYNLMLRDYEAQHHFPYYTRYLNFIFGERVTWFDTGSTTVRLSVKFGENYNPDRNAITPAVSFQQNVKIFGQYDLQNTFTADYMRARDDVNDERNYKLRHSVLLPKLFEKVDVTPSLSLTLKDTMKQKGLRGNELLVNPAVTLARDFGPIEGNFDYSYSKNYSKSKDQYQYTKHEIKAGAAYRF
jgi:tetratricopeptide (TPR) repeat protein